MDQNSPMGISSFPSMHASQNWSMENNPQLDQQIRGYALALLSDAKIVSEIQRLTKLMPFPINKLPIALHGYLINHLRDAELFAYMHVSKTSRNVITAKINGALLKRVLSYMLCPRKRKEGIAQLVSFLHPSRNDPARSELMRLYRYDYEKGCLVELISPVQQFVAEVARLCQETVFPLIDAGNYIQAKEKIDEIKRDGMQKGFNLEDNQDYAEYLDKVYEKISSAQIEKGDIQGAKVTIKELTAVSVRDSVCKKIVDREMTSEDYHGAMSTIARFISEDERIGCYKKLYNSIGYDNVARPIPVIAVLYNVRVGDGWINFSMKYK